MPQIRNPCLRLPPVLEPLRHPLHLPLDRVPAPIQHVRVQVTLQSDLVARGAARVGRVDAPVDADDVVPRLLRAQGDLRVRALGEEREGDGGDVGGRELGAHAGGDALERGEGELFEVVRSELACPGVEDLDELRGGEGRVLFGLLRVRGERVRRT